jgi:galacturan 1,4-alpha-galacturonidase
MTKKIAFIGGGSVLWTPRLVQDMFMKESLKGSHLCLIDIDQEAAELVKKYLEKINNLIGCGWTFEVSELEPALDKADVVIVSISTGGFEAMDKDYSIPEKYGVYHTVSDTVGPGGISRVLRNIPIFIDIARKMEKLCPAAWMLHVTNPLTQITRAVCKATSIKCAGLCHEYEISMRFLMEFLGAESRDEIDSIAVGVNHFTVLKDLVCPACDDISERMSLKKYKRFMLEKDGEMLSGTTDDELEKMIAGSDKILRYQYNFELYEQLGYFPAAGSAHIAENFPFYVNDPKALKEHGVYRKGVLPKRPENKGKRAQKILDMLEGREELEDIQKASHEMLANAVESLLTGKPNRIIAALPNQGQISNLPNDAVVETWAITSLCGINPVMSGEIPLEYYGFMQQIVTEQEFAVEAALTGDFDIAVKAVFASPMLHYKDQAEKLTAELIEANKQWLPQFE